MIKKMDYQRRTRRIPGYFGWKKTQLSLNRDWQKPVTTWQVYVFVSTLNHFVHPIYIHYRCMHH